MRKLIIIRGNSGSGKSTLAALLQRRIGNNTLLLPQDTVKKGLLLVRDGKDSPLQSLLIHLLRYGYENNAVTILEGILNSEWYQPLFEAAAELYRDNVYAYYYQVSLEETLKRHAKKEKKLWFGEQEMKLWWREKDPIGLIPEKILTQDITMEQAADFIIKDTGIIPCEITDERLL